jgi:hypothetical protein
MTIDLIRKESPDAGWRKGLFLSPPRKASKLGSSCPTRLRVRFAVETKLTRESENFKTQLSEEDTTSLWYTREEYALMKRSSSFIVRQFMVRRNGVSVNDDDGDDDELCIRGLEGKTRCGVSRRRKNIEQAIDAVLVEQQRQKEIFSTCGDIYALSRIYRDSTAQCCIEAWVAAQKDARDANFFLKDTIPCEED